MDCPGGRAPAMTFSRVGLKKWYNTRDIITRMEVPTRTMMDEFIAKFTKHYAQRCFVIKFKDRYQIETEKFRFANDSFKNVRSSELTTSNRP